MKKTISDIFKLLIFFALVLSQQSLRGQGQVDSSNTTIIIDNSDHTLVIKEEDIYVKYLSGNVRILHDSTFFYCDSAIIRDNDLFASGNVVILQKDSTTLFSDTLTYNADSLKAILTGKVLLNHQGKELRTKELEYDVDKKLAIYNNGGRLTQDSTNLKSLSGLYDINEDMMYFKDYVSIVDSAFSLNADSLKYSTKDKMAFFTGPTLINQDSSKIYCEAGFYDIANRNAEFREKAKYVENDVSAIAHTIKYIDEINSFILAGNAYYEDKEQRVKADTISYNKGDEISVMRGHVLVLSDKSKVEGDHIVFDHDTGDFISNGRSRMSEDEIILTANFIDFKDKEGKGYASGNIIMEDTISKTSIFSEYLHSEDDNNNFLAFSDSLSRPLMKKVMDQDTLFLSADTLYSYESIIGEDTAQILNAYHNVKIFHREYQAIADSLSYNSADSVFILYKNPVLWTDTTQFTGDTISIFLKNEKIHRLFLRPNAMIVNDQAGNLYNQINGKKINAYFREDSLRMMKTVGNAESLYYMKDDNAAFMGAIKTICSRITFIFEKSELSDIRYYDEPVSTMTTMKQEISVPQRLSGFRWEIDKKPVDKNVDEIIIVQKKVISELQDLEENIPEKNEAVENTEDLKLGPDSVDQNKGKTEKNGIDNLEQENKDEGKSDINKSKKEDNPE